MNRRAIGLGLLGVLAMTGDLTGLGVLKALGAATGASPAPKVFSSSRGLESFSAEFFLEWTDRTGGEHRLALTPEIYARLEGPYNRRNVYGAVLAYGPVLASDPRTREAFDDVARYGLCGEAPLLRELGVDPATIAGRPRVRVLPRAGSPEPGLPLLLEVPCQ